MPKTINDYVLLPEGMSQTKINQASLELNKMWKAEKINEIREKQKEINEKVADFADQAIKEKRTEGELSKMMPEIIASLSGAAISSLQVPGLGSVAKFCIQEVKKQTYPELKGGDRVFDIENMVDMRYEDPIEAIIDSLSRATYSATQAAGLISHPEAQIDATCYRCAFEVEARKLEIITKWLESYIKVTKNTLERLDPLRLKNPPA